MLQNKLIKITSIEGKSGRFVVKDQDDIQYSFFTTKQDGSETQAYITFKTSNHGGQLSIGSDCQITYKEEKKFNEKAGKEVTYRNIVSFLGGIAPVAVNSRPEPVLERTEPFESKAAYGKRLAIHGMVNGMLASGKDPAYIRDHLSSLLALEEAIDEALSSGEAYMQVPEAPEEEDFDPDIPFI